MENRTFASRGAVWGSFATVLQAHRLLLICSLLMIEAGCRETEGPSSASPPAGVAADGVPSSANGERATAAITPSATSVEIVNVQARRRREQGMLDPSADGWLSEAFAERAKYQLEELLKLLATDHSLSADQLGRFAESGCVAGPLRPELTLAYEDTVTRVWRPRRPPRGEMPLAVALSELGAPLRAIGTVEIHVKIIGVELGESGPSTVALYDAVATSGERSIQQTARLDCQWDRADAAHPRLRRLSGDQFEEVHVEISGGRWFTDCTQSVLGHDPVFREQLSYGLNHWMQRIERAHHMDDSVRNGLAIGDANNDGFDDVYLCQGPGLPNRLLIRQQDGTVRDRAAEAGVDWLDQTSSALFLDLDNDGDQDLSIATSGGLLVMENDGRGNFAVRAQLGEQRGDPQSLTAADYDGDGDVDLFLCVYRPTQGGRRGDFVFHDATTGGRNRLFRNDVSAARWSFEDVTEPVGLGVGATRYSLAAAWADYDRDGDQDLYVANDYGRNYLYENQNGQFHDVTEQVGLSDTGFGMSVSWGDYNRDGRLDLYVGNMFSSAGSRITRQLAFQQNASPTQRAIYQRMAKGNTLFVQTEDGKFQDVSSAAAVEMGRWAWSSVFVDLNQDGWEDLVVGNGYITTEDTGDL